MTFDDRAVSDLSPCPTTALTLRTGGPVPGSPEFAQTATRMAREFSAGVAEIRRLGAALSARTERLDTTFRTDPEDTFSRFGVELYFAGNRHSDIDDVIAEMERRAWEVLVDALGIKNVMSVAKRKAFDEQLRKGALPPISEQTIAAILLGLVDQARDFARDAAREVFDMLRPRGHTARKYATNNAFRVGRRVILPNHVEPTWRGKGWRINYHYEQELIALDGVFHLLDGHGVMRENRGPLVNAINAVDSSGRGETAYFRFKCFKNRNLHLEFRNLDLVKQLNFLAAGERVLGEDPE